MRAREKGRNERVRGPAPVSSYSILRGIFTVLPPPPTQPLRNRRLGQVTSPCAPHWGWTEPRSHLRTHHHLRQAGLASAVLSIKERKSAAEFARARVGAPGCSVLNWLRGLGGSLVPRSQGLEGKPPQGSAGPKVGRGGEEEVGGGEDAALQWPRPPASAPRPGSRSPAPAAGSPRSLTIPPPTPGLGPHHQARASIPLSAAPGRLFAVGSRPHPGPSSRPRPGSAPQPQSRLLALSPWSRALVPSP